MKSLEEQLRELEESISRPKPKSNPKCILDSLGQLEKKYDSLGYAQLDVDLHVETKLAKLSDEEVYRILEPYSSKYSIPAVVSSWDADTYPIRGQEPPKYVDELLSEHIQLLLSKVQKKAIIAAKKRDADVAVIIRRISDISGEDVPTGRNFSLWLRCKHTVHYSIHAWVEFFKKKYE